MESKVRTYRALVGDSGDFNKRLSANRRERIPYVDSQTGIAQGDCSLWKNQEDRLVVTSQETPQPRIFSYPAQRWQKKRREYLIKYDHPTLETRNHNHRLDLGDTQSRHSSHISSNSSNNSALSSTTTTRHLDQIDMLESQLNSLPYPNGNTKVFPNSRHNSHINGSFQMSLSFTGSQQPPRSDSVGSYSCVDSDSRDQSSATSQSIDSPHRNPSEEENQSYQSNGGHQYLENGIALEHSSGLDSGYCKDVNCYEENGGGCENGKFSDNLAHDNPCLPRGSHSEVHARDDIKMAARNKQLESKKFAGRKRQLKQINGHSNSHLDESNQSHREEFNRDQLGAIMVDGDRPYVCTICDQSYKTRPGLSYHFIHVHDTSLPRKLPNKRHLEERAIERVDTPIKTEQQSGSKEKTAKRRRATASAQAIRSSRRIRGAKAENEDDVELSLRCDPSSDTNTAAIPSCSMELDGIALNDASEERSEFVSEQAPASKMIEQNCEDDLSRADSDKTVIEGVANLCDEVASPDRRNETSEPTEDSRDPSNDLTSEPNGLTTTTKRKIFCDFCFGTAERNRRTRLPEELISCSTCGSSGHPSCLQFTEDNLLSVKKYKWQCIECKTCTLCNTADNEDQLLICNDCDRSYHTYCLKPPLMKLPDESWSCNICSAQTSSE